MPVPAWAAAAAGLVGGAITAYTYNALTEGEDDEFDALDEDTWGEFYLTHGDRKLVRELKKSGEYDSDEAEDAVAEFLDENDDLVRKFERAQARKATRDAAREATRKASEAKRTAARDKRSTATS